MYISIIIPTYNRSIVLDETLFSFLKIKNHDKIFEILIIDNNSTDKTKEVAEKYSSMLPLKYFFENRQGKNYAVNLGIDKSIGNILVFVDDDITIKDNWFESILLSLQNHPEIDIFGGKVLTMWPKSTPGWVYYSSGNFPYFFRDHDFGNDEFFYTGSPFPTGANFWIRKSLIKRLNISFDEKYGPLGDNRIAGSETEFLKRMHEQGIDMLYIPTSIVYHRVLEREFRIGRLIRRFYAIGVSDVELSIVRVDARSLFGVPLYSIRQLVEEIFIFLYFLLIFKKDKYVNSLIKIAYYLGRLNKFFLIRGNSHRN